MSESKQLTVIERAALALGADEGEKQLIALAGKYTDITDIRNPAGRTQCHAAAMELGNARIAVDKTGKAAREDANAFQKAVIAEVARRVAIIKPEEDRLLAIRDQWDAEREAEKAAKAAAEQQRIADIRAQIDVFRNAPAQMVGKSSQEIGAIADRLSESVIGLGQFAEFTGECQVERDSAVQKLREMQSAQQAHEAEQARLAAEREALERQRAELAEQERRAAAARAEQEARDRVERERVEAEQRAAQERAAAVMRQQQAEHEARMAAQQAEIDRQQADIARAKAEQERAERERQDAIEAEARAKREAEEMAALEEGQRIAEAAIAEAERREREAAAEVERSALAAEVERLHALHFANDGLGMLEDVLQEIAKPIGQECCGAPEFDHGYVCCGNAEPIFHTMESLSTELNKWRNELIQRRAEQKEAA